MERSQRLAVESDLLAALGRLADRQIAVLLDEAQRMAEDNGLDEHTLDALSPEINRVVREACERFGQSLGTSPSQIYQFLQPACRLPVAKFPGASLIRVDRMIGGSIALVIRPIVRFQLEWPFKAPLRLIATDNTTPRRRVKRDGPELVIRAGEVFDARARTNFYLPSPYLSQLLHDAAAAGVPVSAPPRLFALSGGKVRAAAREPKGPARHAQLALCPR